MRNSFKYGITALVFGLNVFIVPPLVASLVGGMFTQAVIIMLALAFSIYALAVTWED